MERSWKTELSPPLVLLTKTRQVSVRDPSTNEQRPNLLANVAQHMPHSHQLYWILYLLWEEQERWVEDPLTPFLERLEAGTKLPFLCKHTRKQGEVHTMD